MYESTPAQHCTVRQCTCIAVHSMAVHQSTFLALHITAMHFSSTVLCTLRQCTFLALHITAMHFSSIAHYGNALCINAPVPAHHCIVRHCLTKTVYLSRTAQYERPCTCPALHGTSVHLLSTVQFNSVPAQYCTFVHL